MKKFRKLLFLWCGCVCALHAYAEPGLALDVGVSHEALSGGRADWFSRQLRLNYLKENYENLHLGGRETERFGLKDQEAHIGGVFALSENLHFQTELGGSASHQILPKNYVDLNAHLNLGQGWGADLGGRMSEYTIGKTAVARFGVERYLGDERFSYTLFSGGPEGASNQFSHRLQWAHYFSDFDWMGVSLVRGQESENLGGRTFSTSQVQGWVLSGYRRLTESWGLNWDAGTIRQGDLYTRTGAQIGLRYRF